MFSLMFLAVCSVTLRWNVFWHPQLIVLRGDNLLAWWWKWSCIRFVASLIVVVAVTLVTPVTFQDWNGATFCWWAAFLALLINCMMSSMGVSYDQSDIEEDGEAIALDYPITPPWLTLFYMVSVGGLITTTVMACVHYFS